MTHSEQLVLFPEYAPGVAEMQRELDSFVTNPGLERLATAFSGEPLPEDPEQRLLAYERIAREYWDIRGKKGAAERQAINWREEAEKLTSEQHEAANYAGQQLNMAETTAPENRHPDWLLLPGAANEAALNRLALGLSTVRPKAIAALASARPLQKSEQERVRAWARDAETEFDLSCAAFEAMPDIHWTIFRDDGSPEVVRSPGWQLVGELTQDRNGDPWRIRQYKIHLDGEWVDAYVIGAPKEIAKPDGGTRRANSHDNFRCFADGVGYRPGMSVAIATTGIYVPMQHLTAVEELVPSGYKVETFGHSNIAAFSTVERYPSQYMQEARAAVDAAVSLQRAIANRKTAVVAS